MATTTSDPGNKPSQGSKDEEPATNQGKSPKKLHLKFNIINVDYSKELMDTKSERHFRLTQSLAKKVKEFIKYL